MQGFESEAIPITAKYVSAHSSISQLRQDTLMHALTWAASPKDISYQQSQATKAGFPKAELYDVSAHRHDKETKDTPKYDKLMERVKFKCIQRLARFMKSKEGRATFGIKKDFKDVKSTWRFAGVDNTAIADNFAENDAMVKGIAIGKRVRIKDPTGTAEVPIQMNESLWVVWMRFVFQEPTLAHFTEQDKMEWEHQGIADDRVAFMEDINAKKQANDRKANPKVLTQATRMPIDTPPADEYYWAPVWWWGDRNTMPDESLYVTESFTGFAELIGLCTERYGDDGASGVVRADTQMFMYPETDTEAWKEYGKNLPEIVLMLRVR